MSTSLIELDPLVLPLIEGTRILDLGCGYGHWGHVLRTHHHPAGADRPGAGSVCVTGVDKHPGNVAYCTRLEAYEEVVESDAVEFLETRAEGAYDTVLALDIIEHLEKPRGGDFLDQIQHVASRRCIVSTPNFESLRDGAQGMTGFNPYERHVSRWTIADFRERGFVVRGVKHDLYRRLHRLRGSWRILHESLGMGLLLNAVAYRCPRLSHTLLAFKVLDR